MLIHVLGYASVSLDVVGLVLPLECQFCHLLKVTMNMFVEYALIACSVLVPADNMHDMSDCSVGRSAAKKQGYV